MIEAVVARTPTADETQRAELRRLRLLAALDMTKTSQAELHRKLIDIEDRTSLGTINRWCKGVHPISEVTLRGLMTVLGLPPDWEPSPKKSAG